MIFSFFNPVNYNGKLTTDIFRDYQNYSRKALIGFKLKTYVINGAPRPEQLAYHLYGNPNLYWVLLIVNNIVDPFNDWLKSNTECQKIAIQRYSDMDNGVDFNNRILYHVDTNGERFYNLIEDPKNPLNWYDKGDTKMAHVQYVGPLKPVDIFEAEIIENEKKRTIKIIDQRDIQGFISNFTREMEKVV